MEKGQIFEIADKELNEKDEYEMSNYAGVLKTV